MKREMIDDKGTSSKTFSDARGGIRVEYQTFGGEKSFPLEITRVRACLKLSANNMQSEVPDGGSSFSLAGGNPKGLPSISFLGKTEKQ